MVTEQLGIAKETGRSQLEGIWTGAFDLRAAYFALLTLMTLPVQRRARHADGARAGPGDRGRTPAPGEDERQLLLPSLPNRGPVKIRI